MRNRIRRWRSPSESIWFGSRWSQGPPWNSSKWCSSAGRNLCPIRMSPRLRSSLRSRPSLRLHPSRRRPTPSKKAPKANASNRIDAVSMYPTLIIIPADCARAMLQSSCRSVGHKPGKAAPVSALALAPLGLAAGARPTCRWSLRIAPRECARLKSSPIPRCLKRLAPIMEGSVNFRALVSRERFGRLRLRPRRLFSALPEAHPQNP